MERKRRGNQQQPRQVAQDAPARKVAFAFKIAFRGVVSHAHPVVQRLQRQVHILTGFHFNHRKAARDFNGQQINDAPVAASQRRHLPIDRLSKQAAIECGDIGTQARFNTAFRRARWRVAGGGHIERSHLKCSHIECSRVGLRHVRRI